MVEGKKEGLGIMRFANGDKYTGEWHDDMKTGIGILTKNGEKYLAEF